MDSGSQPVRDGTTVCRCDDAANADAAQERLEVAVHDADAMYGGEAVSSLDGGGDDVAPRPRSHSQSAADRLIDARTPFA
jgi:hypothetical protein